MEKTLRALPPTQRGRLRKRRHPASRSGFTRSPFSNANFSQVLMRRMLSSLLFAGALKIELPKLRQDAVVVGSLIGSRGRTEAMSETTRRNLDMFWGLVDEFLNAVLFVWIGLEILVLTFTANHLLAGLMAIPVALLARFISVGSTMNILRFHRRFPPGSLRVLTWGGLRGALAIAMALSIPAGPQRDLIVPVTYVVVVFSVLVQGLTIKPLLCRTGT